MRSFDAVSLDIGGVLVVPDHGMLRAALDRAGVSYDLERFGPAHYLAMHEVDLHRSHAEDFSEYHPRLMLEMGVPLDQLDGALAAVVPIFATPLWCQPVPGARAALTQLVAAGVRLAVTSNSDGWAADLLRRHEICQVGDGPAARVETVSDSAVVGAAKPDPRLFKATVDALGVDPGRVLHVGDSVFYDVDGARAAGLQSAHVDPYELCNDRTHAHVRSLLDLLSRRATRPC
jgi:putative hydrolase of the HAD superfamily